MLAKVIGGITVADYEYLEEAEERPCVAVTGIVLVINDLLDRSARVDAESLQLDLDDRHTIDEQENVVPVVASMRSWLTTSNVFLHQS